MPTIIIDMDELIVSIKRYLPLADKHSMIPKVIGLVQSVDPLPDGT